MWQASGLCDDIRGTCGRIDAVDEVAGTRGSHADWSAGGESENQLLSDLPFRCEQRLGRLTRSGHPLVLIAARMRVLPSPKQDLL
jgi:hypothetical protein